MTEIASLRIRVDARDGVRDLRQLSAAADGAAKDIRRFDQDTGKAEKQAGRLGTRVKQLAAGFVGLNVARNVLRTADSFATLQNRIRLVTRSEDELVSVTERLFRISRNTRTEFAANADLYARVARNADELGRSQGELLQFTEALGAAIRVQGPSASESAAGIRQLGQAISANRLQGDEFRSISENLPIVEQIIRQSLGVSQSELRKLSREGQLTANTIIDAFLEARDVLLQDVDGATKTVSTSLQNAGNAFTELLGNADRTLGGTQAVAGGIDLVANNLETVVALTAATGAGFAVAFGQRRIAAIRESAASTRDVQVETLAKARADEAAAKSSIRVAIAEQNRSRTQALNLRLLAQTADSEAERLVLVRAAEAAETRLAARTQALAASRSGLAAATNASAAAEANLSRSAGLNAVRAAASGALSALGGIPGVLTTVGTAAVLLGPQLRKLADSLRGVTKEQRELRLESEDLFDAARRIGDVRGALENATGDEQKIRLLNGAISDLREQLDGIATLRGRGLDAFRAADLAQIDSRAVERFTDTAVRDIVSSLNDGASARQVADALSGLFDIQGQEFNTQIIGRDAVELGASGFFERFPELLAQAGGNLQALDFSELLEFLTLREVPIEKAVEIIDRTLERTEERAKGLKDAFQADPTSANSGILRFLVDLNQEVREVGRSAEELAVVEARSTALAKAIGDQVRSTTRLADIQNEAEDSVRARFRKQAITDVEALVGSLDRELRAEKALGDERNRLLAIEEVAAIARQQGLQDIDAFVVANGEAVKSIERQLNAFDDLQRSARVTEIFTDLNRELFEIGRSDVDASLLAIEVALREAGVSGEALEKRLEGARRKLEEIGSNRRLETLGGGIAGSLVGGLRDATREFDNLEDVGRRTLERLGTVITDTLIFKPLEENLARSLTEAFGGTDDEAGEKVRQGGELASDALEQGGNLAATAMVSGAERVRQILAQAGQTAVPGGVGFGGPPIASSGLPPVPPTGPLLGPGGSVPPSNLPPVPVPGAARGAIVQGFAKGGIPEGVQPFIAGGLLGTALGTLAPILLQRLVGKNDTLAQILPFLLQIGGGLAFGGLGGIGGAAKGAVVGYQNGGISGLPDIGALPQFFMQGNGQPAAVREMRHQEGIFPLDGGMVNIVGTNVGLRPRRDNDGRLGLDVTAQDMDRLMRARPFATGGVTGGSGFAGDIAGSTSTDIRVDRLQARLESLTESFDRFGSSFRRNPAAREGRRLTQRQESEERKPQTRGFVPFRA